jgi:hypothetical protein
VSVSIRVRVRVSVGNRVSVRVFAIDFGLVILLGVKGLIIVSKKIRVNRVRVRSENPNLSQLHHRDNRYEEIRACT